MVLAVAAIARPISELHGYWLLFGACSIGLGLNQSLHASGHMIVIINRLKEVSCSDFGVMQALGLATRQNTVDRG